MRLGLEDAAEIGYDAMLHDVGTFLTYTNHRQHSHYFIRNAELLGLDETEVGIIATTALFQNRLISHGPKRNGWWRR